MNRRDFLKRAASATVGASGLIVLPSAVAREMLNDGEASIKADDIRMEGKIITSEQMIDEAVDVAKFGDNLAELVLNARGAVTIELSKEHESLGLMLYRVYGNTGASADFQQHGRYKLALANKIDRTHMGRTR